MKNRMKKLIPVMLAAIVFAGNLAGTTQVQASEIESRTLDIYDAEVPAVEENTSSDGMRGAAQVPSAYHNTTAELHALYPATRSQGNYNTCWVFSGVGLAEFDLITDDKVADKSIDLSELQAAYFTYHSVDDAFGGMLADDVSLLSGNYMSSGGNMY